MRRARFVQIATICAAWAILLDCAPVARAADNTGTIQKTHEIDAALDVINQSLQSKDPARFASAFSDRDLLAVGLAAGSLAFDRGTLERNQQAQFSIVQDYEVHLTDKKIVFDDKAAEARYFLEYSLSFRVPPFAFHIDKVRETGVLKREQGKWVIVQQHISAPVTNDVWPAYLAKDVVKQNPSGLYSTTEMLDDFDLFTSALEEAHPRMWLFNDPGQYQKLKDAIRQKLQRPLTDVEFYRAISPVVAAIRDGHTRISLSESTETHLQGQPIFFPYRLKFISGKAYVLAGTGENPIQPGSEILEINNKPMSGIVADIFARTGSDGAILTAKYRRMDHQFSKLYRELVQQTDTFSIKYIRPGGTQAATTTTAGVTYGTFLQKAGEGYDASGELLKLSILKDRGVAVLDIRKFVSPEINEKYSSFTRFADAAFGTIRKSGVQHLVIDLRGNGGGDIAQLLVPYLIDGPVQYYRVIDAPRTRYSFLEHTDKGLFFNSTHVNLWNKARNDEGRYELAGGYNEQIKPSPLVFTGRVYVLIDGDSFSATSELASLLRDRQRATFFGEETGGCSYGATGGDFLNLTLENTGIVVRIPIRNDVMNVSGRAKTDRGVVPEYAIANTIQDVLSGHDAEMEFVLNYIANGGHI